MPAILVWLLGGLATMLRGVVPRILFALGIGFAAFTGIDTGMVALKAEIISRMQGLPGVVVQVLSLLRVDQGLSMMFSATLGVLALRVTNGVLTRITMKGVA
jgi:hypothetical protein